MSPIRLHRTPRPEPAPEAGPGPEDTPSIPIGDVRWRNRVRVSGRVRSVRVQPWADVPTLECTLVDDSGGLVVVFLGRRAVAGVQPGTRLTAEGVAGAHRGKLAILNPAYALHAQ